MKTMQLTVSEFQSLRGLKSTVEANSVINFLKAEGIASVVGKKKRKDGKGRSANIYEIPQQFTLTLFSDDVKTVSSETEGVEGVEVVEVAKTPSETAETEEAS